MALFSKKTWKDRLSEYPNRRMLTKENGTTELVTVARSEGKVSQEGDAYSKDNMNDLENRIQKAIGTGDIPKELGTDIISALTTLNTDITVAFGNVTPINSTLSKDFSVGKMGNYVFAHGQIQPQKAFDADTYILLARFSPVQSQKTYFPVVFSDGVTGFGYIDGNGDIYVKKCGKLMQASDWITLNFAYKIN